MTYSSKAVYNEHIFHPGRKTTHDDGDVILYICLYVYATKLGQTPCLQLVYTANENVTLIILYIQASYIARFSIAFRNK